MQDFNPRQMRWDDQLSYRTQGAGNHFAHGRDVPYTSGQVVHNVRAIAVAPDGTVYTNVPWEERGSNVSAYRNGRWIADARTGNRGGGRAIIATDEHIYFAGNRYRQGEPGVDRRPRADISDRDRHAHIACGVVHGLAKIGDRIYASVLDEDRVKVFDADLTQEVDRWEVTGPSTMAADDTGRLWIVQAELGRVARFEPTGEALPERIDLPEHVVPTAIAFDNAGRLLLADAGVHEQIRVYDVTGVPKLVDTFGERGGIYAGTKGKYEPMQFIEIQGIGVDAQGNIYVANQPGNNGSTLIQSYTPDGRKNWELACLTWMEAARLSERDGRLYSTDDVLELDFETDAMDMKWSPFAHTTDRHAYPDDFRVGGGRGGVHLIEDIDGQDFMYIVMPQGESVFFYRRDAAPDSLLWIPAGHLSSDELWVDINGDGQIDADEVGDPGLGGARGVFVDSQGTIWYPTRHGGIFRFPMQAISEAGVPLYSMESRTHISMPEPFTELRRMYFYPERGNMMLLSGFTQEHPGDEHHWKRAGTVLHRYDNWEPDRWELVWRLVAPYQLERRGPHGDANPQGFAVAGDYLFVVRCGRVHEGVAGSEALAPVDKAHVDVYSLDDLQYKGWMNNTATEDVWGHIGLVDLTHGFNVHRRPDGEYVVLVEDNGKSKTVVYRWRPPRSD